MENAVQFLTIAETAKIMRVSNMTIYRQTESGAIPRVKIGSRTLIPASYIQDLLADALGKNKGAVNA